MIAVRSVVVRRQDVGEEPLIGRLAHDRRELAGAGVFVDFRALAARLLADVRGERRGHRERRAVGALEGGDVDGEPGRVARWLFRRDAFARDLVETAAAGSVHREVDHLVEAVAAQQRREIGQREGEPRVDDLERGLHRGLAGQHPVDVDAAEPRGETHGREHAGGSVGRDLVEHSAPLAQRRDGLVPGHRRVPMRRRLGELGGGEHLQEAITGLGQRRHGEQHTGGENGKGEATHEGPMVAAAGRPATFRAIQRIAHDSLANDQSVPTLVCMSNPTPLEKPLYTAVATASSGRDGRVKSDDGTLDLAVVPPKALGGSGAPGTNPEQLFAAGYSACFGSALAHVARAQKLKVGTMSVTAHVSIGAAGAGFGLQVELVANIPDLPRDQAEALVQAAHQVCPYSNATRGNIVVDVRVALDRCTCRTSTNSSASPCTRPRAR